MLSLDKDYLIIVAPLAGACILELPRFDECLAGGQDRSVGDGHVADVRRAVTFTAARRRHYVHICLSGRSGDFWGAGFRCWAGCQ